MLDAKLNFVNSMLCRVMFALYALTGLAMVNTSQRMNSRTKSNLRPLMYLFRLREGGISVALLLYLSMRDSYTIPSSFQLRIKHAKNRITVNISSLRKSALLYIYVGLTCVSTHKRINSCRGAR
jgi:hypothetical protein